MAEQIALVNCELLETSLVCGIETYKDREMSSPQAEDSKKRSLYRRSEAELMSLLRQHEIEQFAEEKRKMVMSQDSECVELFSTWFY